jgi:hypothetical protein
MKVRSRFRFAIHLLAPAALFFVPLTVAPTAFADVDVSAGTPVIVSDDITNQVTDVVSASTGSPIDNGGSDPGDEPNPNPGGGTD